MLAMKNKFLFLFFLLLVAIVPFGYAATEDAIREVGFNLVGALIAGGFSFIMFYAAFNVDREQHFLLQILFLFMGSAGLINLSSINASVNGAGLGIYKMGLYFFRIFVIYIVGYLIYEVLYKRWQNKKGGLMDDRQ